MISLSSTINQFLLDWASTMQTNDIKRILALYDKNAVLLGTIANSFEVKRVNIKDYFVEFLGKNIIDKVTYLSVINQKSSNNPDLLISSGVYVFDMGNGPSVQARFSFVFNVDQPDFILNHHSSIPFDND